MYDALFAALEEAEAKDQLATARVLYAKMMKLDGEPPLKLLAAENLIELHQHGQAEQLLLQVEEVVGTEGGGELRAGLLAQKGNLARARGENEEAEKCYRAAHQLEPENTGLLLAAAEVSVRQGETAKAEFLVRKALEDPAYEGEALFQLGTLFAAGERWDEALEAFGRCAHVDPENEVAELWVEDLEEALEVLNGRVENGGEE